MVKLLSVPFDNANLRQSRLMHGADRHGSAHRLENAASADGTNEENEYDAEDRHPAPSHPLVTYVILAVITAVFLAMWEMGHGNINSVVLAFGAKDNNLIRHGQYWRLVTPIFLHGSWPHLLINGYSLYVLGGSLERIYGSRKYLLIFITAGITGNLLSFALSPTPSLGASGALFGLVGAGIVFPLRFRNLIPEEARRAILRQLTWVAVINLIIGFSLRGIIDNWAHIGGLLGGGFVALFLIPAVLEAEPRSALVNSVLTGLASALIAVVLLSGFLQWRWAMQNIVPPLISYSPKENDPWWTVEIPARWKLQDGVWRSPEGAVLKISDSLTDPQVLRDAVVLFQQHDPPNTELDGKEGWYREAVTPQGALQEYRIHTYDRLFALELKYPTAVMTPTVKRDFRFVTASLRFIHPPAASSTPNSAH